MEKEKVYNITFRNIPEDVRRRLKQKALDLDTTMQDLMLKALKKYLDEIDENK